MQQCQKDKKRAAVRLRLSRTRVKESRHLLHYEETTREMGHLGRTTTSEMLPSIPGSPITIPATIPGPTGCQEIGPLLGQ